MISSVGIGIPPHDMTQASIKSLVKNIFSSEEERLVNRLLPVFDHAQIDRRQLAVDADWFKQAHSFEEKNTLYQKLAVKHSLQAIDACLTNQQYLQQTVPYEAIDMIIFVSSTGLATPSLDTFLMSERPFREDVKRMPLWGLGCAGGANGLARAHDWIKAHPDQNVLLVCCELCSLTFQKDDVQKSNIVGTALFGDGAGAALVIGDDSPLMAYGKGSKPRIADTSSATKKNSHDVMGWRVTNAGLEVIFSKQIPALVRSFWQQHMTTFLHKSRIEPQSIQSYIAHPGGKKVLEAMAGVVQAPSDLFKHSYGVLQDHGNMSSATILYVLDRWMQEPVSDKFPSILSALGPGFSSELLLLEWDER
ncbi:type III polyketide synthase BpsA [Barrientosiimonas marina]|uniref:Type III polyketide synthase n=1 Tax=Lentibacillus kimchii TaxID=1542911 RepID=A0ABW2UWF6_9BACI